MPRTRTAHRAALEALVPSGERDDYQRRRRALLARNMLLDVIERGRTEERLSKKQLAERAGLEPSSVRRMLTAETANPTAENALRLLDAAGIGVEAVLPSGDRVSIIEARSGSGERTASRTSQAA